MFQYGGLVGDNKTDLVEELDIKSNQKCVDKASGSYVEFYFTLSDVAQLTHIVNDKGRSESRGATQKHEGRTQQGQELEACSHPGPCPNGNSLQDLGNSGAA